MNKYGKSFAIAIWTVVVLHGQPKSPSVEQQLKTQYAVTNVSVDGKVAQAGTVLVVRQEIKANPAAYELYWPNNFKAGGQVKRPAIAVKNGISKVKKDEIRFLQSGEKVYVTSLEFKAADLVFSLQSCGTDPYRAELSFQLGKGFLASTPFKEIQDTIGQVLALDAPAGPASPTPAATPPVPAITDAVLRNQDIIALVSAGVPEADILAKIAGSKCQFDTSPDAILQLSRAGATPPILKAVRSTGK